MTGVATATAEPSERQQPPSVLSSSAMDTVVRIDPKIMHGTPCFAGTRVPVESLFDHLEAGHTIDYFLTQFPSVKREQVITLLESAKHQATKPPLAAVAP